MRFGGIGLGEVENQRDCVMQDLEGLDWERWRIRGIV